MTHPVEMMGQMVRLAVDAAICAFVAARNGDRDDVAQMWKHIAPLPPASSAEALWDDLEWAWQKVVEDRA